MFFLCAAAGSGGNAHAQRAVTTAPVFPTSLNPALAVPAGTPVPDAAKLPAVPIAAPPATLPPPVAALPVNVAPATPLTPGRLDKAMLSWPGGVNPAYRAARTPTVSVKAVAAAGSGGDLPASAAALAPITRQGGRFESVGLLVADDGAKVQPAHFSLSFDAGHGGKRVWVQPVDGGTIDGKPGGRFLTMGASGTLAGVFQPPAEAGLYHVVVRLDDVQSVLPFWVLRTRELNAAGSPAEHVLPGAATAPAADAP